MPSLKNNKFIPIEHREVYRNLFCELMNKVLLSSLQTIQRSQASVISDAVFKATGYKFSSKQLQKLINEVAQNQNLIVKPRPGTLNLLSRFVLDEYNEDNNYEASYLNDKMCFWIMYLEKNSHLILNQETIITGQQDVSNNLNQENYNEVTSMIHINKLLPGKVNIKESKKVYDMEVIYVLGSVEIKKIHIRASIFGGFAIGVMNAMFLIFSSNRISGYWNLESGVKMKLVPLITSVDIICGLSTGMFIYGIFGKPTFINVKPLIISKREKICITIIASVIMIIFRQLASRDLIQYGIFDLQIDLETLSYCVVGSFAVIDTLKLMRSNYIIPRIVVIEETFITTIKISLIMIMIYFIYHFVVEPSKLHNYNFPLHSFIYMKFDLPHPERMILVCFIVFFNMLTVLGLRNQFFKNKLRYY